MLPKRYPQKALLLSDVFQSSQKVNKHLGYFFNKIYGQQRLKIAQSGHTGLSLDVDSLNLCLHSTGVTRWLDFFNICSFTIQWKFAQEHKNVAKVGSTFWQTLNRLLKWFKTLNFSPKGWNFTQSGHTSYHQHQGSARCQCGSLIISVTWCWKSPKSRPSRFSGMLNKYKIL